MSLNSPPTTFRVLGVDPGTAATGFGILEQRGSKLVPIWYDCVRTSAQQEASERLVTIHRACVQIIEHFRPDAIAVEQLFFGANAQTALAVGQARGVILLAAAQSGIAVGEYSPTAIKQAVTGYGAADKSQVQRMVQSILGMTEPPRPDHAADALAVAICHTGAQSLARTTSVAQRT